MVLITFCIVGTVNAENITDINKLVNNMNAFDGKVVTIEGEPIGEAMCSGPVSPATTTEARSKIEAISSKLVLPIALMRELLTLDSISCPHFSMKSCACIFMSIAISLSKHSG